MISAGAFFRLTDYAHLQTEVNGRLLSGALKTVRAMVALADHGYTDGARLLAEADMDCGRKDYQMKKLLLAAMRRDGWDKARTK
jgi:hypothetical protein